MKLFELVISKNEGLVKGSFLGQVRLQNGQTLINAENPELKKKLEELFSKPIGIFTTDSQRDASKPIFQKILPNTPEFFKHAYYELRRSWRIFPVAEKEDNAILEKTSTSGRSLEERLPRQKAVLSRFLQTLQ